MLLVPETNRLGGLQLALDKHRVQGCAGTDRIAEVAKKFLNMPNESSSSDEETSSPLSPWSLESTICRIDSGDRCICELTAALSPSAANKVTNLLSRASDCFMIAHHDIEGAHARVLIINDTPPIHGPEAATKPGYRVMT